MVHHLTLFKLRPEVTEEELEVMIRTCRSQLLRIPEVLQLRSGRNVDLGSPWPFFVAMDFESLDKLAMFLKDPLYQRFREEVLRPNTKERLDLRFESDPAKNLPLP
ncbi:MAG: Dabb family protein [Verrucomicrobiota bacterium]